MLADRSGVPADQIGEEDPSNHQVIVEDKPSLTSALLIDELLLRILSHLGVATLLQVIPSLNKRWRELSRDNSLWKAKFKQHFLDEFIKLENQKEVNWFEKFKGWYIGFYGNRAPYIGKLMTLYLDKGIPELELELAKEDANSKIAPQLMTSNGSNLALRLAQEKNCQILLDRFYEITLLNYRKRILFFTTNETDVAKRDSGGKTILYWAIACRQPLDEISRLLDLGADPRVRVSARLNQRLIHLACSEGRLDLVKGFIGRYQGLVNQLDEGGQSPLHWAASCGYVEMVKFLIEQGAVVNQQAESRAPFYRYAPLHWACGKGHKEVAEILIAKDAQLDIESINGKAIHLACRYGQLEIVRLLIGKDSGSAMAQDASGFTPLHVAAESGQLEIVKELLEIPAVKIDQQTLVSLSTPLYLACQAGREDVAKILIERGASLEILTSSNAHPIHAAAKKGLVDIVKMLLEKNPNLIEQVDNLQDTPLFEAARGNSLEVVKFLFEKGAAFDRVKPVGKSLIHVACESGSLDVVKWLLEEDHTLVNKADENGLTPLHYAVRWRKEALVEYLIQKGANVNCTHTDGNVTGVTPLHQICNESRDTAKIMRLLLEAGANTKALNSGNARPKDRFYTYKEQYEYKLLRYAQRVERRRDNNYKASFSFSLFLGYGTPTLFSIKMGYSAKDKKAAAKALISVAIDGADPACLKEHEGALNNGKLGNIYANLRILNDYRF